MNIDSKEFREIIYEIANGEYNLSGYPIPEGKYVENQFAEGAPCWRWYGEMLDAYERICERMGNRQGEDRDVEVIINSLLDIARHMALKMFEYGVFFARQKEREPQKMGAE